MKPERKKLSVPGYSTIIVLMIFSLALTAGCATSSIGMRSMSAVSRYFDHDVDTVWDAVKEALGGVGIKSEDREEGFISTQWVKGWSKKKSSGLVLEGNWQERSRLLITVTDVQGKTYVSVGAQIEEKPPGGSAAYRWVRTPSDGTLERYFLERLENILNNQ
ncbi:MAG: hypothetical protein E3K32_05265 [wastewater metagenome]|nr:hypothetical protein [Candidatus Loosdrechtia aerotolerans]